MDRARILRALEDARNWFTSLSANAETMSVEDLAAEMTLEASYVLRQVAEATTKGE